MSTTRAVKAECSDVGGRPALPFALDGGPHGRPAGTVVEMLQPGYMLHDRLLRPAMVGVSKGAPKVAPKGSPNYGNDNPQSDSAAE